MFDFAAQYYPGAPDDYDGIWKWSIENTGEFQSAVWDFTGIIGKKGERFFIDTGNIKTNKFFPDARLNFVENLLTC